ncbi:MAG TPA: Nramp family divalent metal transporter [Terriglobia bacterium]|nr:Nramp family divalent metal transporter [Terriglobia bacterium]
MVPLLAMAVPQENLPQGTTRSTSWFALVGPGILVAATGVGAGDLLTASLAGSRVGTAILWAALAGSFMKWTLNEGIARWQLATETTLLEGWITRLGRWIQWVFVPYFLLWSFFVGGALITACGVAGASMIPLGDPTTSKNLWGVIHTLAGLGVVWLGGFALFEKLMAACIGIMFFCVLVTAALVAPDWAAVAQGLAVPSIPPGGLPWMMGVLGGVGGTVTLLSYGYWIREKGRRGSAGVRLCRIDLGVCYALTALFGIAMVIIGSRIRVEGSGVRLAGQLAEQLELVLGPVGKWLFLLGFWGAVFTSLLGVWQSAPYLFADYLALRRARSPQEYRSLDLKRTPAYRSFLIAIALVPMITLWLAVERIQLAYAVMGAAFMPLLAVTLLVLNNQAEWVGEGFRSRWWLNAVLVITVLLFAWMGVQQLRGVFPSTGA